MDKDSFSAMENGVRIVTSVIASILKTTDSLRWRDSGPDTASPWKYADVELGDRWGMRCTVGVSSGGVIAINGDPYTRHSPPLRIVNSLELAEIAIWDRISLMCKQWRRGWDIHDRVQINSLDERPVGAVVVGLGDGIARLDSDDGSRILVSMETGMAGGGFLVSPSGVYPPARAFTSTLPAAVDHSALFFQEQDMVELPDGVLLKTFPIFNGAGHRVGKVCGDLREESRDAIMLRARSAVAASHHQVEDQPEDVPSAKTGAMRPA